MWSGITPRFAPRSWDARLGARRAVQLAKQASCNDAVRPNPPVQIGEVISDHILSLFSLAQDLLRGQPVRAHTRQQLRSLLANRLSRGIVFATIQKFKSCEDEDLFPLLSARGNIVLIGDKAHRTQYRVAAKLKTRNPGFRQNQPAAVIEQALEAINVITNGDGDAAPQRAVFAPPAYAVSTATGSSSHCQAGYAQHLRPKHRNRAGDG